LDSFYTHGGQILFSIGVNHHTAPIEIRERVYLTRDEIIELEKMLSAHLSECLVVSTCNRTEIYGVTSNQVIDFELYKDLFLAFKHTEGLDKDQHLYNLISKEAATHLFKVASSMDSMMLGDSQIMHQVKESYQIAQENGNIGKILNKLCQAALHVGKRTKSETALYEGAVSVSYAAVELAMKIFGDLRDKSALILGAGETAELTAESLIKKHVRKLAISNRTKEHAEELLVRLAKLSAFEESILDFDDFKNHLNEFDIIISSTSASGFVLTKEDFKKVERRKSGNPILIADIAVPRDIDPAIGKFSNIFLKDIDDLNAIVDANFELRKAEIPGVNKIISEELQNFFSWYYALQLVPTIKEIEDRYELIRQEEIEKNRNGFSEQESEVLEQITKNIVHKILRTTVPRLNELLINPEIPNQEVRYNRIELIRRLFGLEKQQTK